MVHQSPQLGLHATKLEMEPLADRVLIGRLDIAQVRLPAVRALCSTCRWSAADDPG